MLYYCKILLGIHLKKVLLVWLIISLQIFALEKVTLQLDWKFQFENAGFIMAQHKGFYKKAGLDVSILEYEGNTDIVNDVLTQKVNYGFYHSSIFVENGQVKPIVLLATYLQKSPLVFVAQPEIKTPQQMQGKTIMGTTNELKYSALGLLMQHYKIDANNSNIIKHTFSLDEFIKKEVDVMSAFTSNQLYELDRKKIPYTIIEPFEYGYNMSAGNLFTSKQEVTQNPLRTKAFIEASNKGWKYAINNIDETIETILKHYHVTKSKEALYYEAEQIKRLMMLDFFKIGEINTELTKLAFRQLKRAGVIEKQEVLHEFIYQRILQNSNVDFYLTQEQQAYLNKKKHITMCIDPNWYPFEAIRNGQHIGIAADVMKEFEQKLNTPIQFIYVKSWQESIDLAKDRSCDIFSMASSTPKRLKYMDFTTPYVSLPTVVVTKNDKPFVDKLNEIKGKTIAAVKGYSIIEQLKSKYPFVKIMEVDSIEEGLEMVFKGKAYGYIDNLMVVSSYIQKDYTGVLKVSSKLKEELSFSVGTRNDEPILNEIFEQLVQSLDEQTMQMIFNRWVSVVHEVSSFNNAMMIKIAMIFFILILVLVVFFLYRQYLLKKYNKELLKLSITDPLTKLFNRLKTDEKLQEEYEMVWRYDNYKCSVIILDVDNFKKLNDSYGHQTGDQILIQLSTIFQENTRKTDIVGRWGGEEFMIILPHTSCKEALEVAQIIKTKVEEFLFFKQQHITVSCGVGELKSNQTIQEAIACIDKALYFSKANGRNRVTQSE
jgi:diguanylate cyclase (GGDEF)-like protein